jgi:2-deoxy-D-gluconate 3-dehydrogenase
MVRDVRASHRADWGGDTSIAARALADQRGRAHTTMTTATTTPPSIPQLFDLKGQTAIVTGGALGIGQAIAFRLAEAGAAVLIADINLEAAEASAQQVRERGGKATALRADASRVADAQAMAREAVRAFGRLDILINNAGIFPFAPALQVSEELWDRVLALDLKGAFFCAQAAAEQMLAAGHGGRIVNIASIDGLHPTGALAHYNAAKGGLIMLTKALALEWGPRGITVNAIAPGAIRTPGAAAAQPAAGVADMAAASFLRRIPLGRIGEPDDIATVALFLVSRAAAYMTGSLLVVDGGYLLS